MLLHAFSRNERVNNYLCVILKGVWYITQFVELFSHYSQTDSNSNNINGN